MKNFRPVEFCGAHGNRIIGDESGPPDGRPAILLHGGGQTRHAWQETGVRLGRNGFRAIMVDQRGHGESAWDTEGRYRCADFAADLTCLARGIHDRAGAAPVVIGASLGGLAAMLVAGEPEHRPLSGVVLVDITPSVDIGGIDRITGFMLASAADGFTDPEEAADAVAAYLPRRRRPQSVAGLLKNLRRNEAGRYVWHWDPKFLRGPYPVETGSDILQRQLIDAVRRIDLPLMLVRGSRSELVKDSHVDEFVRLAPHARVADIRNAGHMVAGDRNDVFADAVIRFLEEEFQPLRAN